MPVQRFPSLVCLALVAACGGEMPTPPPPRPRQADRIALLTGDNQEAQVGAPLATPLTFVVGDKDGPLPAVPVTFVAAAEFGFPSVLADTSDATGQVTVTWILGGQLGGQTFSATATGVPSPAIARATARIGPLALLTPVSEPSQFVIVGRTVGSAPAIKATDAFGNPISGQEINFVDATARSTVQGGTAITDAAGRAGVTSWTIAAEPGSYTLQARGPGSTTSNFVAFAIPGAVEVSSGDNQTANAGTLVTSPIAIRALDGQNQPLAGVAVSFTVSGGGGRLNGAVSVKTNVGGKATAPGWILGPTPGANELSVETPGIVPTKFKATGAAAVAAAIASTLPTAQTGFAGNFGSSRPTVRVVDVQGRPVAGETVTFAVALGGGKTTLAAPKTDFKGEAVLGSWRFGAGPQSVTATTGALPPITFTATTLTPPPSAYQVDIRFIGPAPSVTQKAAFDSAAARWSSIILGDLVDTPFNSSDPDGSLDSCGGEAITETIDDLLIFAKIAKIDGPGGILGWAGPCYIRQEDSLSVIGIMQFDVDDVATLEASDRFRDVVLHEMGHIFGIGTLWNLKGLITGRGTGDPFFTGPSGRMAFAASAASATGFPGISVPVENFGGGGTRDAHWRESILYNELMTGYLNGGGANPLSALTAASLRDEGYLVNDALADAFTFGSALQAATAPAISLHTIPWMSLVRIIDRTGRVRRTVDLRDGPFKR